MRLGAVLTDGAALAALWAVAMGLRSQLPQLASLDIAAHTPLVGLIVPVWLGALYSRGSYHTLRRKRTARIAVEVLISVSLGLAMLLAALFLLRVMPVSRTLLVGYTALSVPTLVASRSLHRALLLRMRQAHFDPHRVLVFGDPGAAGPWLDSLARHPEWGIRFMGSHADPDTLEQALTDQHIDQVYVASPDSLTEVARICDELGVALSLDANFLGLRTGRAHLDDFEGWSVLSFSRGHNDLELVFKRALDVTGAAVGLVLLAPVFALVATLVKLQDGGPVLFVQTRAGRYGRPFRLLKFRSMVVNAEAELAVLRGRNEMSGPVFKLADDPRITRVGRWLRRTSLDELPQLVNVLRGEMSLVGPRPHLLPEVADYERWQLRRLSMRPGMTCIWQVSGRSDLDFDRWMAMDLQYVDTWSLWLDLRLLVQTVPAVVRGTGAR